VHRVQQKVKQQQIILMDMWKKWIALHYECNKLSYITFLMKTTTRGILFHQSHKFLSPWL
jgi:hypothetical protein